MKTRTWLLLWLLPFIFLGLFYFYPLISMLGLSFGRTTAGGGGALWDALVSEKLRGVLWFTLWQAALSTTLTLLIGLPTAWLFARYQFWGKSILRALIAVPFVLPTLVVATAFTALLGPNGWLNLGFMRVFNLTTPPIEFMHTLGAIVLVHVFYNLTIVVRLVGDFLTRLDPNLVGAAQMLGASRWTAWRKVTLPLLLPAITAASLLVFFFDFTSFGVVLIIGGPAFSTLETEIYYQTVSLFNLPLAATLALVQLLSTLGLMILYTRLMNKVSRPLRLRATPPEPKRLHHWSQRLLLGVLLAFLLGFFLLPLGGLALRSVTQLEPDRATPNVAPGLTLDFFKELNINRRNSMFYASPVQGIFASFGYAVLTSVIALLVGLPASWALAHGGHIRWTKWVDPILMLPLGTSAVTLGLGFIVALGPSILNLRASPWLIPLAHALVAFPFVIRSLTPALRSIQPELRNAAASLGAAPWRVWRFVDLPLVGRALLSAGMFAFMISLGEFGATALVGRPEYPTIPVMIYRFLGQPGAMNYGQAMALSTVLMLVTMVGILLVERMQLQTGREF